MELLHSKILGKGKPIIILHGFLGMSDNWKTLGSQYANNGYQVHLVDQRNHGKSFHSENFDYELMSADVLNYMDYHQIENTYLIGHSMGGKTAMQLATNTPDRVDKLIVADISPKYYPPHHQPIIDALGKLDLNRLASRKEADETLSAHLSDFGIRQFLLKNLHWVEPGKLGLRFNFKVLKDKMDEIGENIATSAIFNGAALFLRGNRSEYIMPNDYPEIYRHFPNASIESIDNAGHWLHTENPKQFLEKTLHFLNS